MPLKKPSLLYFLNLVVGFSLLFSACNERYLYRNKVHAEKKRGTVTIKIINQAPQKLNAVFEEEVREYCIKRLGKEGYRYTTKNPQYEVVLEMSLDSSFNTGINYANKGTSTDYYIYSVMSKTLTLNMEAKYINTNHIVWVDKYELYFFDTFKRDLNRTKGVLKYMLSGINETR
ncbi:MAG: hypothetical protein CFE21_04465 [Bacteroidetes bacterium B1(2017)]|nr:MAG: hypothetical protein CFE21_04465 [Bacteroidetes bacterium B1(2017)]